jgi:hypothetical protein
MECKLALLALIGITLVGSLSIAGPHNTAACEHTGPHDDLNCFRQKCREWKGYALMRFYFRLQIDGIKRDAERKEDQCREPESANSQPIDSCLSQVR